MHETRAKLLFSGRHGWLLSLITIFVLLATSAASLTQVTINNAPEVYFPSSAPAVVFEKQLRQRFPTDQQLVVLLQGANLYSTEIIDRIKRISDTLETNPLVDRVLSVVTVDRISGSEDGFRVEPLLDPAKTAHLTPEQRRERVVNNRFTSGVLASQDGSALALVIRPKNLDTSLQRLELVETVELTIKHEDLSPYVSAIAGTVAQDAEELKSTIHDNVTFIPLTLVVGLLLIGWMFRKPFAVGMAGLAMIVVTAGALAILPVIDQPYTLVSSMTAPLLGALTIALLIHFYTAMALAERHGVRGPERVKQAVLTIRNAARFTSITTIAGFGSLMFSTITPIQVFGLIGVVGELLVYVTVIVLLPPLFIRWDTKEWRKDTIGMRWLDRFVLGFARIGIRHAGKVSIIFLLITLATLPFLWQIRAETDILKFFAEDHPLTLSTKKVEEQLVGITPLEIVFDVEDEEGLKNPATLNTIKEFQRWAESLPGIDRSLSMTDIVEDMNWAFHGENPSYRVIPDNRRLISQLLFIYDGRDLPDFVDNNYRRTRVALFANVHGATEINALIEKIESHLRKHPVTGLKWHVAGFGRLFADQQELLVTGQVRSLWGAVLQIFVIMLLLWRSVIAAGLCVIPNIAPIYATYVLMGMSDIWLDMGTALIASVALGVAVDDTIHLFHGYAERARRGIRPSWALARNYRQAGRAVTTTSVILCIPFFLLTFSSFQPTSHFGLLTTFGLLTAMLFDLLLLPALLISISAFRTQFLSRRATLI